MKRITITLESEEIEHVKIAIEKQIRLLTLKLDNGCYDKSRIKTQEQLNHLRMVRNRL